MGIPHPYALFVINTLSPYVRRTLYFIFGLLGLVLLLVVAALVALQFPATQDFAARQAARYLQNKLGTEVRIGKFRTDFRHDISLDDVYVEDQQQDTLLAVGHLGLNLDLWALASSEINLKSLELNDGRLAIRRTAPDSVSNYDFIVDAFAAPADPAAPADTTAGFTYNLGDLHLTNILLTYQDQVDGNDVRARVGDLAVTMDEVDVDQSIYKVNSAALKNTGIRVVQSKVPPDTPAEPLTVTFGLNRAALTNVNFTYRNQVAGQFISTRIGQAEATADNIDLIRGRVDLDRLTLRNTSFAYAQNENVPVEQRVVNPAEAVRDLNESVEKATGQATNWVVTLKQSDISGVDVAFDNFDEPRQRTRLPALDYNHLKFTDLVLNTENLYYSENRTTGRIRNLAGREQSGFRVESAQADVVFDSVQTRLDNLDLVTPHTRLRRTLAMRYQSLDALADAKQLPNLGIEGDLRDVRLGFRDILYLAPDLAAEPPFNTGPNQSVLLSGQVSGRVGDFRVRNLEFVGFRNTVLRADGRIRGLPATDGRLYTDLTIRQLSTTATDLRSLLPRGTIPAEYRLPERMSVAGTFRGRPTAQVFDANLRATTSFGNATARVNMGPGPRGQEPITATFATQGLDVGKFLRDPTIGKITATGKLNARGLTPETMRGKLTAQVQSARYNGYTYRGVTANVGIDRQLYTVDARSTADPNLDLDLLATVNLRDARNPTYRVDRLNLRGANLTALGFYTGGDLRVQGDLQANLRGSDLNSLNGTFSGSHIVLVKDKQAFALNDVTGRILQQPGRTEVDFASSGLDARLRGNTRLGDLALELQRHLDRYFDLPGVQYRPSATYRQFSFEAQLKEPKLATGLVPGLQQISPFQLTGSYDSRAANLTVDSRVPLIKYQGYTLDSLRLHVGSDPQQLDYALRLRQARQDTTLRLPNPTLTGSIADNKIGTHLRIAEADSAQKLNLSGVLQVLNQGAAYAFSLGPDLVLNNQQWTVAPGNTLRYTTATGAVFADNVQLSQGRQVLKLQTLPGAQYPLQATLTDFDLNGLAKAGGLADSLVAGTLNGQAVAYRLGQPRQAFTADLTLSRFAYNKAPIGDLALKATNSTPDRYDVDARLTNATGTDVRAVGYYLATPPSPIRFEVAVNKFDLNIIEPFSAGQLREMLGGVTGNLAVAGTVGAPQISGGLTTTPDAGFTLTQLGAPYRLVSQEITFGDQGLRFDDFVVRDSLDHRAVINGDIYTRNYVDDFRFDLEATTENFLAVQSTQSENPLFWGTLVVDSDSRITGNLNLPVVNTRAVVVKGSDLKVAVPNDEAGLVESEGIVKFVDKSAPLDTLLARLNQQRDTAETTPGYDVRATVTVHDDTPFTIVIDPISGDNLKVYADGTLNTRIDPTGNITLNGRVEVAKGKYAMSLYGLASRNFDIAPGSYILWTGDPYNAQMSVAAIYNVKAPPAELLSAQGLADETLKAVGRNQLPFQVYLNVTGELLKPTIGFDIRLPEEARSELRGPIETRLAQLRQPSETTELNKQVFSLIVLNRFLAQDPFQNSNGSFVANQLRGSASQVLTDQLNNLTGSYLSNLGVELGVNSYADYSSGSEQTRTDLNVAVRRQLFNNRVTVRLGTDVPLGGGNQASQGQSGSNLSAFAGDVSIEYNVLANGRIRLRAFRNNAYGDIDGQFVRTGASLIFQRDYKTLAELFHGIDKEVKEEVRVERRRLRQDRRAERDSTRVAPAPVARRDSARTPGATR